MPSCPDAQMLLEAAEMRENIMELRVNAAITSNRIARMDNPIIRAKIVGLQRKMAQAQQADCHMMEADAVSGMAVAAAGPIDMI